MGRGTPVTKSHFSIDYVSYLRSFVTFRPVGRKLGKFFSKLEPSIACLKIAHIIFFCSKICCKVAQFASFVFHQQNFQQIFASHEPSFGPYKFAQKFATSSPSPNFSTKSAPSVSREARVRRSGDSARECRVAVLLATSGAGRAITICREKRRARRQWRELTHADLVDF